MSKHSHHPETRQCYACGHARPIEVTRPFGHRSDGSVVTHVCRDCEAGVPVANLQHSPEARTAVLA